MLSSLSVKILFCWLLASSIDDEKSDACLNFCRNPLFSLKILAVFFHLRSWFPVYSWRIYSLDRGFWVDSSFFSLLENYDATSSGLRGFCIWIFSHVVTSSVFSWWFQEKDLDFNSLTTVYLGIDFFVFIFFGIYKCLQCVGRCIFSNLGNFQPLFLFFF